MDDLLVEFLAETEESITELDSQMIEFEQNPNNDEILGGIFRIMHTIKGTSGFLALSRLEKVAHASENIMSKFREGREVIPMAVTLILKSLDRIRDLLSDISELGSEPEGDDSELINELNEMAEHPEKFDGSGGASAEAAPAPVAAAPAPAPAGDTGAVTAEGGFPIAAEFMAEFEQVTGGTPAPASDTGAVTAEGGFPIAAEFMAEFEQATASGAVAATEEQLQAELEKDLAKNAPAPAPTPPAPAPTPPAVVKKDPPKKAKKKDEGGGHGARPNQSIRVDVGVLENLMTLVSELVLTRNQLMQVVRDFEDSSIKVPLQRLSHITSELQDGVMKTRMQPIGNAWNKMPRIVRDLSMDLGKKIDLQMVGEDTELDRQVLELIRDPLTHMVRNAVDHGVETPDIRATLGKPETGILRLEAFHEGGHIVIQIFNDGAQLPTERIRAKAVKNGLCSQEEVDAMPDSQVHLFIFAAGFSTAAKVTNVSGRGVGMDVVRTNIEKIGGVIELESIETGVTFTIKIPLTLAIVSALILESSGQRFAIPQISVLELVLASNRSEHTIEMINDAPVLRLRNQLLPLVSLGNLLQLSNTKEISSEEDSFVVVAQVGSSTFGIIVDRVFDTEEIVVKPVSLLLKEISIFSGNTILGDGSVVMILDPNGIANATGNTGDNTTNNDESNAKKQQSQNLSSRQSQSLLLFRASSSESSSDSLKCVPLSLVSRLDEVEMKSIEYTNGKPVVQYRGILLPLVPLSNTFVWPEDGNVPMLVFTRGKHSLALIVNEIIDIVEDNLDIELGSEITGILGTAVIDGHSTDIVDVTHYLVDNFPDWFDENTTGQKATATSTRPLVLVAEKDDFFRNLLIPQLSAGGNEVIAVTSTNEIESVINEFSVSTIVTSVDLGSEDDEQNIFDFVSSLRTTTLADIPVIGLASSMNKQEQIKQAEIAGFDAVTLKSDTQSLLKALVDVHMQDDDEEENA